MNINSSIPSYRQSTQSSRSLSTFYNSKQLFSELNNILKEQNEFEKKQSLRKDHELRRYEKKLLLLKEENADERSSFIKKVNEKNTDIKKLYRELRAKDAEIEFLNEKYIENRKYYEDIIKDFTLKYKKYETQILKIINENSEDHKEIYETKNNKLRELIIKLKEEKINIQNKNNIIFDELSTNNKNLKNKLSEFENDKLCKICMTNEKNIVLIPCGHYIMCNNCEIDNRYETIDQSCPICRELYTQKMKVYN